MAINKVKVLVLRAPGTNCDNETAFAFEKAGAEAELVHVNRFIAREKKLADYQVLVIPGGFTYGDDISAGKVLANELKVKLGEDVQQFIDKGGLILGICNGFQVLAKSGWLPGPVAGKEVPFTLTNNNSGRFECRWAYLGANKKSVCVFTKGIERMYLPVAHGEGKVVTELDRLPPSLVALYYTNSDGKSTAEYPDNPNGSDGNIAGVCDMSGRVFALMPHPERYIRGTQHPRWTRRPDGAKKPGDGLQIFKNAVGWARGL